jgi:predicted nucleotidyltransferase
MSSPLTFSPVQALETRVNAQWKSITQARELSAQTRSKLRPVLAGLDSEDSSVVVSGSLARGEFTPGSDIDWTLLIDGQADPNVVEVLPRIEKIVSGVAEKSPGREGTFGTMAFSHDLIHQIGGEDDTNRNTTRRILLLLESSPIGRPDAYERVLKSILQRYINEDDGFRRGSGKYHVPRFLQNDFARYWRTMAVDFAYKRRSRFGKGAAMRNFKLRMSRKLIYVSGLLACFSCQLNLNSRPRLFPCPAPVGSPECVACLRDFLRLTPLEILATTLLAFPHLDATARRLFDAYDEFLGMLADKATRKYLESLPPEPVSQDRTWDAARHVTHDFRDGLLEMFFDEKSQLYNLTRMYGVF